MKVLHVSDSLKGGGTEKLLHDLLPILCESYCCECEVLVLTLEDNKYAKDLMDAGIRVTAIPERNHLGRIRYIREYVEKKSFDLVHAHLFPVIYYCALAKRLSGSKMPPLLLTEHSTDNKRRHIRALQPFERFIYGTYSIVVAISDGVRDSLTNWLGSGVPHITVVHNGIPLDDFYHASSLERNSLVPSCIESDILLCMVGSISTPKNHLFMIEVLRELTERYHLVCIGEGLLENEVRQRARELSVDGRLHLLGFRRDVASCMKTCDVAVIPSIWEGFGLVAVEAMACGLPVVSSDVPGLSEVVSEAGITCATYSPKEFAYAVRTAARNAKDYKIRSLKRSRAFDIYATAEKYAAVYSMLCTNEKSD